MKTKSTCSQNKSSKQEAHAAVETAGDSSHKHEFDGAKITAHIVSEIRRICPAQVGGYALAAIEHLDGSAQAIVVGPNFDEAVVASNYRDALKIVAHVIKRIKANAGV